MNDTKKLSAFVRQTISDGVVVGVDHPFAEAVKQFYANVDVLGTDTAEWWLNNHKEQAELISQVYEAYNAEEPVTEAAQPVTEAADITVNALDEVLARLKALEDAQNKPTPETTPAAEEPPAQEA